MDPTGRSTSPPTSHRLVLLLISRGIAVLNLDASTISKIFRGEIRSWQDPALTALNPKVQLLDLPITAVARSDDSGTTENFTEYLHSVAPDAWPDAPDGSWPASSGIEHAQGNTGVVTTVTRTVGAIAYADDSLVDESLGKARLKVGASYVQVSGPAAARAVAESERVEGRGPHDIALKLDRETTAPGAYPLVLVSYLVFCSSYSDPQTVQLVKSFGQYVVSEEGQQEATESAKSAPMPPQLAHEASEAIDSITLRSAN